MEPVYFFKLRYLLIKRGDIPSIHSEQQLYCLVLFFYFLLAAGCRRWPFLSNA
jgi:hypothetical protein